MFRGITALVEILDQNIRRISTNTKGRDKPTFSQLGAMIWHFFFNLRLTAIHNGIFALLGGRRGPYAPWMAGSTNFVRVVYEEVCTEMNAVFSIEIKGTISMSCWDATSSSSGGVTEERRVCGSAIVLVE
jgi:hypothetical protein